MPVEFVNDPFAVILEAFARRHPTRSARVELVEGLHEEAGVWGQAWIPDDAAAIPEIQIDADAPIRAVVELLSHELAHVATPHDGDHGPAWQFSFEELHADYCAAVESRCPMSDPDEGTTP